MTISVECPVNNDSQLRIRKILLKCVPQILVSYGQNIFYIVSIFKCILAMNAFDGEITGNFCFVDNYEKCLKAYQELLKAMGDYRSGDYDQAYAGFKTAAEQGLSEAKYFLGSALILGPEIKRDVAFGIKYLTEAANEGFKPAIYDSALFYLQIGKHNTARQYIERYPQDPKFKELRPFSQIPNNCVDHSRLPAPQFEAQLDLNSLYRISSLILGFISYKCGLYQEAIGYFEYALRYGNFLVEDYYLVGHMNFYFSERKEYALKYMVYAAEKGFKPATFDLGMRYFTGVGVTRNPHIARSFFAEYSHDPSLDHSLIKL